RQVGGFSLDPIEAADARADVHADTVVILFCHLKAGVGHRLGRSGEGEVNKAAHLASLFFVDEEKRIEVLDLGGEADGMACEIEGFNLSHTTAPTNEPSPDPGAVFAHPPA